MLKVTKFRQFYFPELNFNINGLVKLQTKTCWSANKTVANILPETRNKNAKMLWSYTFAFAVIDFNRTKIMKIMSRYLTTSLFLSYKIIIVQNNSKCKLCFAWWMWAFEFCLEYNRLYRQYTACFTKNAIF